ncbi:hypothetical protein GCM10025865_00860 [Paraoerskovia sediminicola]|uniref:Tail assembly chaperone n=1 Tax=Paraoerskovia sediminicola TaxID=1138587 RepID=A0ABN6XAV6_9CELL|nr:hypothetical protein [Paraoerskovia sediminicola]BDZ40787.1 hypothetical protein GCM10025865_00860 [Paraoerskovia sediminicola]
MSESRYFQYENGCVVTPRSSDVADSHVSAPGWTEVQVVPLDAIVIQRDELPEVKRRSTHVTTSTGCSWPISTEAETVYGRALEHLAVAAYLSENPPVDEAQVKALNALIVNAVTLGLASVDAARGFEEYLVRNGVTVKGADR